jgi:class 3 adenylate cyclase
MTETDALLLNFRQTTDEENSDIHQQLELISAKRAAHVIQNASDSLFGRNWLHRSYDEQLQNRLSELLVNIAACGLVASMRGDTVHLVSGCNLFSRGPKWPSEDKMRSHATAQLHRLRVESRKRMGQAGAFHVPELELDDLSAMAYIVDGDEDGREEAADSTIILLFYAIDRVIHLFFSDFLERVEVSSNHVRGRVNELFRKDFASPLLPMFASAFRYRDSQFTAFSPAAAMRYWEDAKFRRQQSGPEGSAYRRRVPPWDTDTKLHETVTISVDLRKSTYCMEFAKSEEKFARWVYHLVVKMREVAHLHGGVFDKFTGDGCLVHFLQSDFDQCGDDAGLSGVDHALACAVDLQRAIEIHMRGLRKFLKHDSPLFGAGIAIDVDSAHWSSMRGDPAPIVVGKGVVGACRVGNKAPRLSIRLTNVAYNELCSDYRERLSGITRVNLETKEVPGSLALECWEFKLEREVNLGKGQDQIAKLCEKVRRRLPNV